MTFSPAYEKLRQPTGRYMQSVNRGKGPGHSALLCHAVPSLDTPISDVPMSPWIWNQGLDERRHALLDGLGAVFVNRINC